MKIEGSVSVVTGASSGIGLATAIEFAKRGAVVVGVGRNPDGLERMQTACREHSPSSLSVAADLGTVEGCDHVLDVTVDKVGPVDILVNNAGASLHRHATKTSAADVEWIMEVNFLSAVRLASGVMPGMLERGSGSIVSVTSVAGYIPNPSESAYGASKAAMHLWTHGLGVDLHGTGVHACTVSPGPIDTPIWGKDDTPSAYKGRKYPPEVVAKAIAKAVTNEAVHVTVPRQYGAVGAVYGLPGFRRLLRRGLIAFDD